MIYVPGMLPSRSNHQTSNVDLETYLLHPENTFDKKSKVELDINEEIDFTVLAINSHIKGYKLCWNINKRLHVNFEKKKDHNIQDNLWFSRYMYICEEGVEYNLLANRSKKGIHA